MTDPIVERVDVCDLFKPNDVLNLTAEGAKPAAAISFVASRPTIETPWSQVLLHSIHAMLNFVDSSSLRGRRWNFFGATELWRLPTAINTHKKFWGASQTFENFPPPTSSVEVEVRRENKVRYAVATEVTRDALPVLGDWNRATQSGVLWLDDAASQHTEDSIRGYFKRLFKQSETNVDWHLAINTFCSTGSVLVRCSGAFDDQDASVDLIYDPTLLTIDDMY